MNLTKTPYLVLIILLAGIGIGTVSALITITFEGHTIFKENAQMDKDLNVDGTITGPTIEDLQNQISILQTKVCNPETCNGEDDDCDGLIDEEGVCPSTETNCSDGIDNDGDTDVDCLDMDCNGMYCDDGLFCNGSETCQSGVCTSSGTPCLGPDGDMNCQESCDESNNSCTANDPDNTTCGSSGETCHSGVCAACDPLDPSLVCGTNSHCFPTETGDSICSGPTGGVGQGLSCTSNDDCLPEFACIDPGSGLQCLQLCKVGGSDCPASTTCVSIIPNVFIGSQEWGLCVS